MTLTVLGKGKIEHSIPMVKCQIERKRLSTKLLYHLGEFWIESLESLETMVVPLFEKLRYNGSKNIQYPIDFHPWGKEQLMQRLCIVPMDKEKRTIILTFPLPDFSRQHYEAAVSIYRIQRALDTSENYHHRSKYGFSQPENYVSHYLLHTGRNTLVSTLQKRGLAKSMRFNYVCFAGFAFVNLAIKLTLQGLLAVDNTTNLVFQVEHISKSVLILVV